MLIYEKKVDNVRKLYCNYTGTVPTNSDVELSYKDSDGNTLTLTQGDSYVDGGSSNNIQKIKRLSDNENVVVYAGDNLLIGSIVSSIVVTTQPTKVSYSEGDKFDPTGLKLKVTYTDGTEITLDADAVGITYDPDEDTSLATTDTSVTVAFGGKTTTITITVT